MVGQAHAQKRTYESLENKKYYFSALNIFFRETLSKKITDEDIDRLDRLVLHTGITALYDYEESVLVKYPNPSIKFVLAHKAMEEKNDSKALELISHIPEGHYYFAEAQFLKAQIHESQKQKSSEYKAYSVCQKSAAQNQTNRNSEVRLYYKILAETCMANKARLQYESGHYQKALNEYSQFKKNTYKWPYLLLERAWTNYQLGDYNRALGLLVTYKSPLLDTYFFPEAEYLMALIYYKLCLYKDSASIINHYDKYYRPRFKELESIFKTNKPSNEFFFNLMLRKKSGREKYGDFVRHTLARLKKQTRFTLGAQSLGALQAEMRLIRKRENVKIQNLLMPHLREMNKNMIYSLNSSVRLEIFKILKSVRFFSDELFKINLEIVSRTKDLIYDNKQLISDRSRGDASNVKRRRFEYFWMFEKEFWADELGDYSFGLKSNCETVEREQKASK
jgi:hypothetical protein